MEMIDEKDMQILMELKKNSRQPSRAIAKKIKTTSVTVANRIEKLEKNGIITGYSVDLDYSKIGYKTFALVEVEARGDKIEGIWNHFKKHPNVMNIMEVSGQTDLILICRFGDNEQLREFIKKELASAPFVKRTNTRTIFIEEKNKFACLSQR
jgi:DNA-binding Lrp family transcriptional regulator